MLSRIGFRSVLARVSASSPHGYQSTGLFACCSRYGLVSLAKRLGICATYPRCAPRAHRRSLNRMKERHAEGGRVAGERVRAAKAMLDDFATMSIAACEGAEPWVGKAFFIEDEPNEGRF